MAIFTLHYLHYRHIYVYPFFGRGSISFVDEWKQRIIIVYDGLLWNALVVRRVSAQYCHVHASHRSTSSVGLAGADGDLSVTRTATEHMHELRRKKIHYGFPYLVASFISLFIVVGLGLQLLDW